MEHKAINSPLLKRSPSLLCVVFNSCSHLHHRFICVVEDSSVPLFPEVPEDINDHAIEPSLFRARHFA